MKLRILDMILITWLSLVSLHSSLVRSDVYDLADLTSEGFGIVVKYIDVKVEQSKLILEHERLQREADLHR